jgi:hypothetical protein
MTSEEENMNNKFLPFVLITLFLSGCVPAINKSSNETATPIASVTETATRLPPTRTPVPSATAILSPTPDFSLVGLPVEQVSNLAFDFVAQMCNAEWSTRGQQLPCPGDESQKNSGYVMRLAGEAQGLSSNLSVLLVYPPQINFETISSKYPSFTVKKGDRFRAVLTCRAHTSCDVEYVLDYSDDHGHSGLKQWRYIFTDSPLVVDYPLDAIAGKTVQFDLAVRGVGNPTDASTVWIAPHIYRPVP